MECASAPRKTYSVRVENIPEHERLIFKLIFSVSHKTRGRNHAYVLHEECPGDVPDLVLSGKPQALPAGSTRDRCAVVVDRGELPLGITCIERPLIATRVLGALDQLIASACADDSTDAPGEARNSGGDAQPVLASVSVPDVTLLISEEEASELAFVDDEALSNPANTDATVQDVAPSPSNAGVEHTRAAVPPEMTTPTPVGEAEVSALGSTASSSPDAPTKTPNHTVTPSVAVPSARRRRVSRALVVDDSFSVRKQMELELNFFSADVDYAGSATEAVRLLDQNYYDVAFLDVVLPDSDGFQICKRIKATSKSTNVIMLTGRSTQADRVKGALAGCDAYLVKPVGRATFQGTVKDYLEPVATDLVMGT